ncbi:hypothetical protein NSQ43_12960 [Sporosarcina sp. FSL W8-0480]|uniref:hypothetical protein n=1 Tax=Sporosarcina sp. FSL W8-0480 TaxID=2954701 RepID=UPI0030DB9E63
MTDFKLETAKKVENNFLRQFFYFKKVMRGVALKKFVSRSRILHSAQETRFALKKFIKRSRGPTNAQRMIKSI